MGPLDGTESEVLFDPDELIVRFYFAADQLFHLAPGNIADVYSLDFHTAKDIESAHPDILKRPQSEEQYRPISELKLMRSVVTHLNTFIDSDDADLTSLARKILRIEVNLPPKMDPQHGWAELPASVFAVSVHLDTLHALAPNLRSSFTPYNYLRTPTQITSRVLDVAFNEAVAHVIQLTETSYKLARNTVHPFSAKLLAPQIPYAVFRNNDSHALRAGFIDNNERGKVIQSEITPLSSNALTEFGIADERGPLDDFIFTMQEATSAFARGLNRSAVLIMASATETFLNTFLLLIHWENETLPEDNAQTWDEKQSIVARVKTSFSQYLGGSWDLSISPPLMQWSKNLVGLRNDVAHGGRTPTSVEVKNTLTATNNLVSEMIDRVTNSRNRKRYARTAFLLAGDQGLEKRGISLTHLHQLQEDPSESLWRESSDQWISQHLSCLQQKRGMWDEATPTELILVVRSKDHHVASFEYARHAGWAREVKNLAQLIAQLPQQKLPTLDPGLDSSAADDYITINVTETAPEGVVFGQKVPAYRLVPYLFVMPRLQPVPELHFVSVESLTS